MYKAIFPPLKMVLLNLSSIFSVCISISNCNMGAATTSGKTSTLAAATAAATSNCRLQINLSCLPLDNLCILSQDRTHTHAGCRTRHLQNLLLLLLLLSLMFHYIFFAGWGKVIHLCIWKQERAMQAMTKRKMGESVQNVSTLRKT